MRKTFNDTIYKHLEELYLDYNNLFMMITIFYVIWGIIQIQYEETGKINLNYFGIKCVNAHISLKMK